MDWAGRAASGPPSKFSFWLRGPPTRGDTRWAAGPASALERRFRASRTRGWTGRAAETASTGCWAKPNTSSKTIEEHCATTSVHWRGAFPVEFSFSELGYRYPSAIRLRTEWFWLGEMYGEFCRTILPFMSGFRNVESKRVLVPPHL